MHYITDKSMMRSGSEYCYEEVPGGWVGYPVKSDRMPWAWRLKRYLKSLFGF